MRAKLFYTTLGATIGVLVMLWHPIHTANVPRRSSDPVEIAMEKRLPLVRLEGTTIDGAMHTLTELYGVPIVVEWDALLDSPLRAKTPVNFRMQNATLG